jgi:hypothetical protein
VADTISIAKGPLLSFSLVLICLVTLFAGAGLIGFGQKMEEFHDMYNAVISTLIVVTTGSSDVYVEQYKISPFIATIWYWLLIILMYLVCLRLILCILMDAYGEASEDEMVDDTSLFEQGLDTLTYLVQHHVNQVKTVAHKLCGCSGADTLDDEIRYHNQSHLKIVTEGIEDGVVGSQHELL